MLVNLCDFGISHFIFQRSMEKPFYFCYVLPYLIILLSVYVLGVILIVMCELSLRILGFSLMLLLAFAILEYFQVYLCCEENVTGK